VLELRGATPLFFFRQNAQCPLRRPAAAEFSLYTTASKKSIGKLHKKSCLGSPEIVQLFERKFLTSGACGGILFTEVKRGTPKGFQKDFEKLQKTS
jgi:hypothetical protein